MTESPKRIWTEPSLPGYVDEKSDLWTVEYIRADLVHSWSADMDAAPKDGTEILLFKSGDVALGSWDAERHGGFWGHRGELHFYNGEPTHWRHIDLPND